MDEGERAAISLAREIGTEYLLIDEKVGRKAAADRKLAIIGTVGILLRAAKQELLDLNDALTRLTQTDFFVSDEIIKDALSRVNKRVE